MWHSSVGSNERLEEREHRARSPLLARGRFDRAVLPPLIAGKASENAHVRGAAQRDGGNREDEIILQENLFVDRDWEEITPRRGFILRKDKAVTDFRWQRIHQAGAALIQIGRDLPR